MMQSTLRKGLLGGGNVNTQTHQLWHQRGPHPLPPAPRRSPLKPHPPQTLFSAPPPRRGQERPKRSWPFNPRAPHSWEPINVSSCFYQAPKTRMESHISSSKRPCQLNLNDHTHFTGEETNSEWAAQSKVVRKEQDWAPRPGLLCSRRKEECFPVTSGISDGDISRQLRILVSNTFQLPLVLGAPTSGHPRSPGCALTV